MIASSSSQPCACITHSATEPLSDITWHDLPDYMQVPPEPQKALFRLRSRTLQDP